MSSTSRGPSRARRLEAALIYARRGIPVFPCKPSEKKPLTINGFKDATTDPARIREWWRRWPNANIGIPTGERSGILSLDVDTYNSGAESLDTLEKEHAKLPETAAFRTGRGGMQIVFRYPADGPPIRNSTGQLRQGLDVRGEGGYIVAPPSHTEGAYEWLERRPPTDPPPWLLEALRQPQSTSGGGASGESPTVSPTPDGPQIPDGARNNTLTSIAGQLHDGSRSVEQLAANLMAIRDARCENPGTFTDAEVKKIARSIHRRRPCKRSSSVAPLGPEGDAVLEEISALMWAASWPYRGGYRSAASLLRYLLAKAHKHGRVLPCGFVWVQESIRSLSVGAGLGSHNTARKGLELLRREGWIRFDNADRSGPEAGAFVLCIPERAKLTHSTTGGGLGERGRTSVSKLRVPFLRHPTAGCKRLGKGAEQAVANAESAGGSVGVSEVARFLGIKRERDVRRRHLSPLEEAAVANCSGRESLTLREGWAEALERRRVEDGEVEAARLQQERYERQREAFREAWARGEVVSAEELARRRLNREGIRPEERHVSGLVSELKREPNGEHSPSVDGVRTDAKDADQLRRGAALAQERIAEPSPERPPPARSRPERVALLLRRLYRDDKECFAALRSDPRALAWEISGRGWTETIYCGNTIRSALEVLARGLDPGGAVA